MFSYEWPKHDQLKKHLSNMLLYSVRPTLLCLKVVVVIPTLQQKDCLWLWCLYCDQLCCCVCRLKLMRLVQWVRIILPHPGLYLSLSSNCCCFSFRYNPDPPILWLDVSTTFMSSIFSLMVVRLFYEYFQERLFYLSMTKRERARPPHQDQSHDNFTIICFHNDLWWWWPSL